MHMYGHAYVSLCTGMFMHMYVHAHVCSCKSTFLRKYSLWTSPLLQKYVYANVQLCRGIFINRYICMHIHGHAHTCAWTYLGIEFINFCTSVFMQMYVHLYLYAQVCLCICTSLHKYVHTHVWHVHVCACTGMFMLKHVYTQIILKTSPFKHVFMPINIYVDLCRKYVLCRRKYVYAQVCLCTCMSRYSHRQSIILA